MYYTITFILLILLSAAGTGWLAKKIGKSYRFWFGLSIPMPVVAICILICLPEETVKLKVEKNEKETGKIFITEDSKPINIYETNISATA